jgi:hypothetical protein
MLSENIDKQAQMGNQLPMSNKYVELHTLVLERARLFMHSNNESLLHDARWLENNLELRPVQYIEYKMGFKSNGVLRASQNVHKTAAIKPGRAGNPSILFVTPKYEFYDIAVGLVRLVLQKPKPHSALLLESLLSTGKLICPQYWVFADTLQI